MVDFNGQSVEKIVLNHQPINVKFEEGFIFLDVAKLKEGKN